MKRFVLGVCWQVGALTAAFVLPAGVIAGAPETRGELANFVIQDCGSCHGLKLKGGLGPPLRPADIAPLPESSIAAIIREGVPGTAMPPWKALLTDRQIAWISRQLKSGALIAPESDTARSQ